MDHGVVSQASTGQSGALIFSPNPSVHPSVQPPTLIESSTVYNTHLYEEPGRDERQAAVLPVKSIVVRVEGEVIQVEKSETEAKTRHQIPWNNLVERSVSGNGRCARGVSGG